MHRKRRMRRAHAWSPAMNLRTTLATVGRVASSSLPLTVLSTACRFILASCMSNWDISTWRRLKALRRGRPRAEMRVRGTRRARDHTGQVLAALTGVWGVRPAREPVVATICGYRGAANLRSARKPRARRRHAGCCHHDHLRPPAPPGATELRPDMHGPSSRPAAASIPPDSSSLTACKWPRPRPSLCAD